MLLLKACAEGPMITKKQSHKLLLLICQHMGRWGLHTAFPDVWEVVRDLFDSMLESAWKDVQAKKCASPGSTSCAPTGTRSTPS